MEAQPLRCSVVVDSRNMHGQGRKLFGRPHHVTVGGIRTGLRNLGFDVEDVHIGIATRTSTPNPSQRLARMRDENIERAATWRADGARVIEGMLAERRGDVEEKQVDVLCALGIAELAVRKDPSTLVLLSEDMDLLPACQLATKWGARAVTVAPRRVHERDGEHGWALLSPSDLAVTLGYSDPDRMVRLRRRAAEMLAQPSGRTLRHRVIGWDAKAQIARVESNAGVIGQWAIGTRPEHGSKHDLHVVGAVAQARDLSAMPLMSLSETPAVDLHAVQRGVVSYWSRQDSIVVALDAGGTQGVSVPAGEPLLPGQPLLLLRTGRTTTYVGPLGDPVAPDSWPLRHLVGSGIVTGHTSTGHLLLNLCATDSQAEVLIPQTLSHQVRDPIPGAHVRLMLVGQHQSGRPMCHPLSSGLTQPTSSSTA